MKKTEKIDTRFAKTFRFIDDLTILNKFQGNLSSRIGT